MARNDDAKAMVTKALGNRADIYEVFWTTMLGEFPDILSGTPSDIYFAHGKLRGVGSEDVLSLVEPLIEALGLLHRNPKIADSTAFLERVTHQLKDLRGQMDLDLDPGN